jgi:ABC-type multidrug transport system fused ATPase/permease subunit
LRRLERDIVLDRLRFRYDNGKGAGLDGVSLRIAKNEIVAVVGSSGAGKSTLIDLLAGVQRGYEGRILVDGVELREIDLSSWRRRIGYATQDVILFNDTLRNNLLFARPDATAAEVAEALRLAHLTDLVASLPKGLDTELAEGGARFSGGQRQRIALARTLIAKPDLLFLDEATSALDSESERIIQTAIESVAHSMTIVVIAHRLSTVRKADVIHVLEDGRVVESGTFGELMAKRGRFAALHEFQVA